MSMQKAVTLLAEFHTCFRHMTGAKAEWTPTNTGKLQKSNAVICRAMTLPFSLSLSFILQKQFHGNENSWENTHCVHTRRKYAH